MKSQWKKFKILAFEYYHKCDYSLQQAVYHLMREKGFQEEIAIKFRCDFTSGTETVISYDHDGELADLCLELASTMTKEEIIEKMGRYMTKSNLAELKRGRVEE